MKAILLRLFENINIKHYYIRKTSIKKVEVPNTASISRVILFHVSKFLEKMVLQLV